MGLSRVERVRVLLRLIKVEHTLFALPFLYSGAVLASGGVPEGRVLLWITLGLFAARTAGMCLNRLIDREIDAANPRTARRVEMLNLLSPRFVWHTVAVSFALLLLSALMLNPLCVLLFPLVAALLVVYPYTKRFTWLSHLVLGSALGMAPLGAWAAVRGSIELPALLLFAAVMFWVAGFDVIYALQDVEFDLRYGLFSIPARFGEEAALRLSEGLHLMSLLSLWLLMRVCELGAVYGFGLVVMGGILALEHLLARRRRIGAAFFHANAVFSAAFLVFILLGVVLR